MILVNKRMFYVLGLQMSLKPAVLHFVFNLCFTGWILPEMHLYAKKKASLMCSAQINHQRVRIYAQKKKHQYELARNRFLAHTLK